MTISKTPQFDRAIDEIISSLVPHERMCRKCNTAFNIEREDINFFRILQVPPPTICPGCRERRRYGHLFRMPRFFKKKCSAKDHNEEVISLFPPDAPHIIYDVPYWYSDGWDAVSYAREFNSSENFFPQFKDLYMSVPHLAVDRDLTATNCDYTVGGRSAKNNYYCGGGYKSEDCMYCANLRFSKACVDCTNIWNSELCFASVGVDRSNKCIFIIDSANCMDSAFLYDCKNCTNCFLSSNLRNKSYVFDNKQLTKEEYEKKINTIHLGDRAIFSFYKGLFEKVMEKSLRRALTNTNVINSTGDRIADCKNCSYTFDGSTGENLRYLHSFASAHESLDVLFVAEGEQCYESVIITIGSKLKFSMYMRNCIEMEYSSECQNCKNCFGCVGLRNKSFHIFNTPYAEDEYWKKVDEIKTYMLKGGEYGDFFDLSIGLIPYQSTSSQYYFPMDEEMARTQHIPWYPEPESHVPPGMPTLNGDSDELRDIRSISSDVLKNAILCEKTKKPFRVVGQELDFYKRMNIPFPTEHPWERIISRKKYHHPMSLFDFVCPQCNEKSFSVYSPEEQKKLKIFCEKCYLREVV